MPIPHLEEWLGGLPAMVACLSEGFLHSHIHADPATHTAFADVSTDSHSHVRHIDDGATVVAAAAKTAAASTSTAPEPVQVGKPDETNVGDGKTASGGSVSSADELKALHGGVVKVDLLNNNNSQYYGDFTLGNPKQRFTAIFDTGSGIVWVPGSTCKSAVCQDHHRFDSASSDSHEALTTKDAHQTIAPTKGEIRYGTGHVKYDGGLDTLTFCDSKDNVGCHGANGVSLKVSSQPIGMSTDQTNYPFSILPFDGILGLSPSSNPGSVMHQLKTAHALPRNVLGIYLSEDTHRTGSVDFGGIEPMHIAPDHALNWHANVKPTEWSVAMKDITVNGKPLHICDDRPGGTCPAVMDTGSSLITGPTGEVEKLLKNIHTDDTCKGLEKMPEVSIQIVDRNGGVVDYPLTPKEYTLRSVEEVPGSGDTGYYKEFPVLGGKNAKSPEVRSVCEPGIGVMDVPGRKWVLGDTFLRRYYSIYDDDRGLVGLVRSIHPDENMPNPPNSDALPHPAAGVAAARTLDAKAASIPYVLGLMTPPAVTVPRSVARPRCRKMATGGHHRDSIRIMDWASFL